MEHPDFNMEAQMTATMNAADMVLKEQWGPDFEAIDKSLYKYAKKKGYDVLNDVVLHRRTNEMNDADILAEYERVLVHHFSLSPVRTDVGLRFEYTEKIVGKDCQFAVDVTCTKGLLAIRGNLGMAINATCDGCMDRFFYVANNLYSQGRVFYGKVSVSNNQTEYLLFNYYPLFPRHSRDEVPYEVQSMWHRFCVQTYNSLRTDIHHLMSNFITAYSDNHGVKTPGKKGNACFH
jgi:hypothetical protein